MVSVGPEKGLQAQSHEHKERVVKTRRVRQRTNFKAQMDSGGSEGAAQDGLEENQEKEVSTQAITTFDDSYSMHTADTFTSGYVVNDTMPKPDLDIFLKRPIILGTYNWASTAALGTSLATWQFPDVMFTTTMQAKLEKMAFWRPDIEITIRMNGTPMHYGKLVFAWIPQAKQLNPSYTSSYFSMFSNKWLQVSASSNQATSFVVPFTHYKERATVGFQVEDFFTLYCNVAAPLNSVNGVPPSINFTVYARVVNTGLSGYSYSTNWVAQSLGRQRMGSGKIIPEAEQKTDGGKVVSSSVSGLGDAISKFTWVPVIGSLAAPVSQGIKAVGSVLKWFGLSVPVNAQLTHPMQIRQPRLLTIEDTPTTLTLGVLPTPSVSKDYALVNDCLESASLISFIQRPALFYVGTITNVMSAGDTLFSSTVTPTALCCYDYTTAFSASNFVGTPLQFMSRCHAKWRGGLRIHLSFICSHFHSTRVRLWYVPWFQASGPVAPNETQGVDVVNTVIDITSETDYSFTIPFCQESEWLECQPGTITATRYNTNGFWGLSLINPLTSGAATVNPMYYQIFVSAASDFQFAEIDGGLFQTGGMFKAQSLGSTECEIPSSSMACLRDKEYPVLGGSSMGRMSHSVFNVIETTSIKQLTNMVCPILKVTSLSTTLPTQVAYYPFEDTNVGTTGQTNFVHMFYNMQTVFRYFRGGTRLVLKNIDPNLIVQMRVGSEINAIGSIDQFSNASISTDDNDIGPTTVSLFQMAVAQFNKISSNPADWVHPWYYKYKCALTRSNCISANSQAQTGTFQTIQWYSTVASNKNLISLGGADDFLLGFQLGIPAATRTIP